MIGGFSVFMIAFMFTAMDQFEDEVDQIGSYQEAKIKTISSTERSLIDDWVKANNINVPDGAGYRYVLHRYPSKPWSR